MARTAGDDAGGGGGRRSGLAHLARTPVVPSAAAAADSVLPPM